MREIVGSSAKISIAPRPYRYLYDRMGRRSKWLSRGQVFDAMMICKKAVVRELESGRSVAASSNGSIHLLSLEHATGQAVGRSVGRSGDLPRSRCHVREVWEKYVCDNIYRNDVAM